LLDLLNNVQQILQANPTQPLANLAYTLSTRTSGTHRLTIIAKDVPDLQTKLNLVVEKLKDAARTHLQTRSGIYYAESKPKADLGKIAFLFPGEGSQYPNMLADLCLYFPKVRAWFDFLDKIFIGTREQLPSRFIFPPPLGLSAEERQLAVEQIYSVDIATTAVFTTSMALYELLKDFNIPCDMMVGHSTGENTALVASGIMRVADRAKLMEEIQHLRQIYSDLEAADSIPKGQLLAVGAVDSSFLKQLIDSFQGRLYLAIDNCPNQVVLFGNADDIDKAVTQIREVGGISTHLPFDRAYHTPLFEEVVSALAPYYKALEVGSGHTSLYSCATTDVFPTEPDAIRTLAAKQWSRTVRFREIIEKLYAQGARTFIEVGPSSNLTGFVGDILSSREHLAIASNSQRRAGLEQIQHLLARLFVKGIAVDMTPLYKERELTEINLHPIVSEKNQQQVVPVLDLTMPVMRLAPSVIETIREKLHPDPEVNPEPISTSICQQSPTGIELLFSQEKGDSLDKGAKGEEPASMYSLSPLSSLSSRRDNSPPYLPEDGVSPSQPDELLSEAFHNPVDTQFAVLSAHFELMQEFLASQSRVTTALYSSPVTYINSDENSLPANLENDSLTYEQYWSLLGQVIEQDSQHLYCQRVFDINLDRFLYDHTLGGQTSQRHPEVLPLPVIPFTVSMEILAEAAHHLVGGHKCVTSLYNIRSYRWLALERGSLTIDIQAWVQPGEDHQIQDVQVQLFQVGTSEEDNRLLVFEGTVRLSDQFLSSPAPMAFHFDQPKAYCLSDEELYCTGMFHGPQFQSVKHVRQVSKQGIEADLQVIGIDNFFSHIQQPIFQIDAPLLDAATQLVAYWVVELVGMNFHTFPFQITAFEQYGMPAPPGTTLIGRGMMHFKNERQIESSFDFLDETGRVIAHIEGLLKAFLNVPLKFHQCFASPKTAYWSDAGLQDETGLVCRRMAPLPAGFLDELGGIIRLIGVHLILNEQEREFWYSLPENGSRRNEWLLGRVVAKDAVRQWAKERFNLDLAPVDIQILSTNLGKPLLYCPELEAISLLPDLSISHSHNHFIAAVAMPGRRIGVDIQRTDSVRSHDLLEGAFTSLELDAIAQLPQQDKQTIILGAWCAKEAAAKAAGTGLKGNPRQWQMSQYDLAAQKVTITHADESFGIKLYCSDGEILAICHQ
jgi:malonyl CoA-acyl carrier protein transacylase/phosphopantetheinyl transferase